MSTLLWVSREEKESRYCQTHSDRKLDKMGNFKGQIFERPVRCQNYAFFTWLNVDDLDGIDENEPAAAVDGVANSPHVAGHAASNNTAGGFFLLSS
jgi:hypothetical protein